jgi:Protein of unknown function, DUF624
MTHVRASAAALPRGDGARETARRATECALLGVLWLLFSLPVVTAGAAWLAVCEICDGWSHDVEAPLLRTFVASIRHRLVPGLTFQLLASAAVLLPLLELRIALSANLPGARLEAALLGALAAGALVLVLLACCETATRGVRPRTALRDAAQLWRHARWAGVGVLAAVVAGLIMVWLMPVLGVLMAGPVGFAVTAVRLRASRESR